MKAISIIKVSARITGSELLTQGLINGDKKKTREKKEKKLVI